MNTTEMQDYLKATDVIDWQQPAVLKLAKELAGNSPEETAKRCFEYVRDNIRHSWDYQSNPVTCSASEVLEAGTGYCYAKSHLLAALLRANDIPAGLCYQRLTNDETSFCLHGLNAVYLPEQGWYRIDARGNKTNVHTEFKPYVESLAYQASVPGEADLPGVFADPLPQVIHTLRTQPTVQAVYDHLPDVEFDPQWNGVAWSAVAE